VRLIASGASPPSRPSADLLLATLATVCGPRATAVVLSGGGHDGATGATAVHDFGGTVLASSELTSQYFSMPRAAIERGSVIDGIVPLGELAALLVSGDAPAGESEPGHESDELVRRLGRGQRVEHSERGVAGRGSAAKRREAAVERREDRADERERIADEREGLADARERVADERERLADEREGSAERREVERRERVEAAAERQRQAQRREQAQINREIAATGREMARDAMDENPAQDNATPERGKRSDER
jgi:hypothetical protein